MIRGSGVRAPRSPPAASLLLALWLATLPGGARAAESGLFTAVSQPAPRPFARPVDGAPPGSEEVASSRRLVRADFGLLAGARETVLRRFAAALRLNLFDDATFDAVPERTKPTSSSGYSLSGHVPGIPFSRVTVSLPSVKAWSSSIVRSRRVWVSTNIPHDGVAASASTRVGIGSAFILMSPWTVRSVEFAVQYRYAREA